MSYSHEHLYLKRSNIHAEHDLLFSNKSSFLNKSSLPIFGIWSLKRAHAMRKAGAQVGVYVEILPVHTPESSQQSAERFNELRDLRNPSKKNAHGYPSHRHTGENFFDERWESAPVVIRDVDDQNIRSTGDLSHFWRAVDAIEPPPYDTEEL